MIRAVSQKRWTAVDRLIGELLAPPDAVLEAALAAGAEAGLPPHEVSPPQGRLLELLARLVSARAILEIGTLGAYSTIWLARGLAPGGRLVTLEANPDYAAVARANLERAGLAETVELRVGPALATLPALVAEGPGPFDLIFIDADKRSNPEYLRHALALSRAGTLIVADNVVRGGALAAAGSEDPDARGARRFLELLAAEPRVVATALQTVGSKGHDGFAIALVTGDPAA
jgi:predicted O-methyltransferase YrrM